ncbi:MAG: hypothetical protein LBH05_09030 [Deferribacteraceae bacterium]|jgi:hypothetical protein|nr:hypothetical protein [Deferribacteraceae bacterium]
MSLNLGLNFLSFSTDQQQSVSASFRTLAHSIAGNNVPVFDKNQNMDTLTLSPSAMIKRQLEDMREKYMDDLKEQEAIIFCQNEFTPTESDIELMEKIAEFGKKYEKTLDVDDVTWGALAYLGDSMGITDPAMLAELEVKDAFQYSHEFLTKRQSSILGFVSGELNCYETTADFWSAKFIEDEQGNLIRNENFNMTYIEAVRSNVTVELGNLPTDMGREKLHTWGPAALIMMAQGINENNHAKIMWAYAQPSRQNPDATKMTQNEQNIYYAAHWRTKNHFYNVSHQTKDLTGEWLYERMFNEMSQRGAILTESIGSSFLYVKDS